MRLPILIQFAHTLEKVNTPCENPHTGICKCTHPKSKCTHSNKWQTSHLKMMWYRDLNKNLTLQSLNRGKKETTSKSLYAQGCGFFICYYIFEMKSITSSNNLMLNALLFGDNSHVFWSMFCKVLSGNPNAWISAFL